MNVRKMKVMTTGDIGEVTVDWKNIEVVTNFVFLGALITKDVLCEKEVRIRIAMGKATMGGLTSIWKDIRVTLETKVKLVKVLVFPIVLCGAETWTMRKHERRKIDAFELWCWSRVLRVSWMERKPNMFLRNRTQSAQVKYKTYKNKLTTILIISEKQYYNKLLAQEKNNMKGTWAILNTVIKKAIRHQVIPRSLFIMGQL